MSRRWLEGLNPEQIEAVCHNEGPLLILAGAGSGKTTVLVSRAGRLIDEKVVEADRLCVLTFTNKAARELKARVGAKLGKHAEAIWAGTFHSFGLHLLRKHYKKARLTSHFGILDTKDTGALVKELLTDFRQGDKTAYDADRLLSRISDWRARGQTEAVSDDEYDVAVEWLLPRYLKRLEHLAAVDFDSLILKPIELMEECPDVCAQVQEMFRQVMVDEFQDTNEMQMKLIRKLVDSHRNLSVVGDDDQSIYGWRGACISNILNFPKLYQSCKVVRLERNYRSTPHILALANAVIANNKDRHGKVLRSPENKDPGKMPALHVAEDENEEAEFICGEIQEYVRQGYRRRDIALLYRSNSLGAFLEAELRKNQIPYTISGGTAFFDRKETRDILAYLRCGLKANDVAFRRIINTPSRGIGEKTLDLLNQRSLDEHISFLEAARRWREKEIDSRVGEAIEGVFALMQRMVPEVLQEGKLSVGTRLLHFFEEMGYRRHIEKHAKDALVAGRRWKHLEIFADVLDRFVEQGGRTEKTLQEFLDAMELRDAVDESGPEEDKVQMLTLHACKGLEFPVVFLMGIEEDILPHKTLGSDIAEERRLFYVGITRAEEHLILTRSKKRRKYGRWADTVPSRFLLEIPKDLIVTHGGPRQISTERRKSMVADLFAKLDALDEKEKPISL